MIKVLVVEDSPVVREFLVHVLSSDPEIKVVGTATDGEDALEALKETAPDVVTMDIHMPKMDGFEATRRIMETSPTPIVIVTGSSEPGEVGTSFRAMEAGALAVVPRPQGIGHPEFEASAKELQTTVKLMSEVKVVRRWNRTRRVQLAPAGPKVEIKRESRPAQVVGIGASTGGPIALQTILSGLKKDFPVPVLVVQHMAAGFTEGFIEWLNHTSGPEVRLAVHGDLILPGHVYVAPDGLHMGVKTTGRIALSQDPPENGLRPSVSFLFRSLAQSYGPRAVGILLTGMGRDGAEELKLMRERGAVTLAQDEESSVVYGMPGAAIKLDAAQYVLAPEKIVAALHALTNNG
ncbi:MAG TPA: chemotaxis response regulator protein-glutamate methylesterase [Candidatus Acidoferrales bacterium]|nr:chemotaxis response regulator protein-glutamate methylesterase [Candidatus Acidoferrales bacterium]